MSATRAPWLDARVNDALDERARQGRLFYATMGPVREIVCETAGAHRQVAHGLGAVPTGVLIHWATGPVYAATPEQWTADLAWLVSPTAYTRACVSFYVLASRPEMV